jgi:hypothetical protein
MRALAFSLVLSLTMSYTLGQEASGPEKNPSHGAIQVVLLRTLESSKLKDGDAVQGKLAAGIKLSDGSIVTKDSLVTGHVEGAKARSKGDPESQLTLRFDKLTAADGGNFALKGFVQAVFDRLDAGSPERAGAVGERGPAFAGGSVDGSNPQVSGRSQYVINTKATGVFGVEDVQLSNGVLSSKGKQVKLIQGVRLVVAAEITK